MTLLPVDQEARERALNPQESFHLEAPAGSGKTSVLLARFLALLSRVETPEELLAVTFTRKAAGELRTRVMELLWPKKEPGTSPWDQRLSQLAAEVLRHFDRPGVAIQEILAPERLPVTTFHGFCAQLLRLAPEDAGVPLDFRLLEENEASRLQLDVLEELRRRLNGRPAHDPVRQALVRRLVRLNNDWPRLAGELQGLIARRDSLGDFLELAQESREPEAYHFLLERRYRMALTAFLQELSEAVHASLLGQSWGEFRLALQGSPLGEALPAQLPGVSYQDLASWQAIGAGLFTTSGTPRKQLTAKHGFPTNFDKARWSGVLQALPAAAARQIKQCSDLTVQGTSLEEAAALQDLVILLGEALPGFDHRCRQQRALDFVGLEQAALGLLRNQEAGELLLRLDCRLQHLLVDEFQDTSSNQMDLLCRLMAGWQAGEGRTLTVVGDPKQSIYGWRQAKPRLFQESRRGLPCGAGQPSLPLQPELLETNFRATSTLIKWTNAVFGDTVMQAGIEGARFHCSQPRPGAQRGPAPSLSLFTAGSDREARELEARWLAQEVAAAREALPAKASIGILLFTRTHLPVYLQAFAAAGLTVLVQEGLKLADSPVVAHLHNLARALVRPQDDLSWATLLRGPWAAQPLSLLAALRHAPGESWSEKLRRGAAEGVCPPEVATLATTLAEAVDQAGRRPLGAVIADWLTLSDSWKGLAAWEGAAGVANAQAYLELLHAAESGLPETTFLKADFDLQKAFQPPDPRAQDSAVEVLTVHGAKGLEFDQVFLPFLDWQPVKKRNSSPPPYLLEELPGSHLSGLALARPYHHESQSSFYKLLQNFHDRRLLDESRRVFYVAATRAKQRLALSGIARPNSKGEWAIPLDSPLGWLRQHYELDPPAAGTAAVWPAPELRVALLGEVMPSAQETETGRDLPMPWEFEPEPAPYCLSFPSQLVSHEEEDRIEAGGGEAPGLPRIRGEVIHRALETVAKGGALPEADSLAAALRREGLAAAAAALAAPAILAELQACLQDPFLARLLDPALSASRSEWRLEDWADSRTIRRGKIDRAAFDDEQWWLLDYKTSRPEPGQDWEEFITGEAEKYRPQLQAYREMAARAQGLAPEAIQVGLYFTAGQQFKKIS
jgi:ATP-dependent helicase/nuclease subunit A